jgi:AcrR family transcriptional regulator
MTGGGGPPMTGGSVLRAGVLRAGVLRAGVLRGGSVLLGAGLLGAGCVVWAAAPVANSGYAGFALFLAIVGVTAGVLRLALAAVPAPEDSYLLPVPLRAWIRFLETLRQVPWEEGALVAILWLEVLHPARPWHTAVLGAALIGYLLATHLAESGASPEALRPQVRVLAVGAGLLALGAGAGMIPAVGPGAGSALLRLVAAGALIVAAGLVLPYVAAPKGRPLAEKELQFPGRRRTDPGTSHMVRGSQIRPPSDDRR